ncbi:MAG: hypothetical protein ABGY96_27370 [bacterium]|jgi:hypothetical protein
MAKINDSQINYIDAQLKMAAKAEISADQLIADEHFMLALEADELLTQERMATADRIAMLLSDEEHDHMEKAHANAA